MGRKFLLGTLKIRFDNSSRPNMGFAKHEIGFEAELMDTKAGVPNTVSHKGMLFHDQFQCWRKMFPITYINTLPAWYNFFALVHHTFSSTSKSRYVFSTMGIPNNLSPSSMPKPICVSSHLVMSFPRWIHDRGEPYILSCVVQAKLACYVCSWFCLLHDRGTSWNRHNEI